MPVGGLEWSEVQRSFVTIHSVDTFFDVLVIPRLPWRTGRAIMCLSRSLKAFYPVRAGGLQVASEIFQCLGWLLKGMSICLYGHA